MSELEESVARESPLLLDPCDSSDDGANDPERFFTFDEDAIIRPRPELTEEDRLRAEHSIQVYALNRASLVFDRAERRRVVDHHFALIKNLSEIHTRLEGKGVDDVRFEMEQLIAREIDFVLSLQEPAQPFSAMVREMIRPLGWIAAEQTD